MSGTSIALRERPSSLTRTCFWAAAALALAGLSAHELIGAPMVLPPLSGAGLAPEIVWLHRFSWHVGSIAVAAMIALYVAAGLRRDRLAMAVIATAMSAGFATLGIGLATFGSGALWGTPAPYAWTLVTLVGGAGIATATSGADR